MLIGADIAESNLRTFRKDKKFRKNKKFGQRMGVFDFRLRSKSHWDLVCLKINYLLRKNNIFKENIVVKHCKYIQLVLLWYFFIFLTTRVL